MSETNALCVMCGRTDKFLYTNMMCTECHDGSHETKDCSKCNSKCKKDSPCGFFTKRKSITEIANDILHRRWSLRRPYQITGEDAEREEEERRHQIDMEAMWRDQQHEPPEAHIDEYNPPEHIGGDDGVGNTREE